MGVPFDNVTSVEAIALIEQMIASRRPHYLVTPNVDFLVQAARDVELRRILFEAHLVVCDGTPLLWASRLLGNPLPERVAGADLVPSLIRVAAQKRYSVFFLGASPASIERAVKQLGAQYPDLRIAGYYSPPYAELLEMDHQQIAQRILAANPDLLFVAFGCPKQEKWIAMHYRSLGVPLTAGVGGTIDFLGGALKRAPRWMQTTGTEWVFRLLQEPRRLFRRYARDLWAFGWNILPQWWWLKAWRPARPKARLLPTTAELTASTAESTAGATTKPQLALPAEGLIQVPDRLDLVGARQCASWTVRIRETRQHWLLDMSRVTFIDSTGVGLLIQWKKLAQDKGFEIVLIATPPVVDQALALLRLQDFFLRVTDEAQAQQVIQAKSHNQWVRLLPTSATGIISLAWHGEITAAIIDKVWNHTRLRLGEHPRSPQWTIDLSSVTFLDSSGIGLMIRLKKYAQQCDARVLFTNLRPAVHNVLRLAHLQEYLLDDYTSGC